VFGKLLLLAFAFQVGPFYEQRTDYRAVRPFWAEEAGTTDLLWPLYTSHDDWWRFAFFTHYQENREGGYQFEIMPLWFNGRARAESEPYWGLFPLYGSHPHILMFYDLDFVLWPVWMRYRTPRARTKSWMTSNVVLAPFVHWRDDGSWGVWPFGGVGYNRADEQRYVLWPFFTWKEYYEDRDTGGKGAGWMCWPFYASIDREREQQWQVLPPLVSYAETPSGWRGRYPWPLVEIERMRTRSRTSVFPFYEHVDYFRFLDGQKDFEVTRFGWRLVELLPEETRVFPFCVNGKNYFRLWPFWESTESDGIRYSRCLPLVPIRWIPAVDRNWSKFWTFYESAENPVEVEHSLFWGLIRWRTVK